MAKKRRVLKDIDVREVSLVDHPANLTPFLFWKRDDSASPDSPFEKAFKELSLSFKSDGTVEGSTLVINGTEIGQLQSITLSASPMDDRMSMYCSYTQTAKAETAGGFKPTYTYTLSKSVGPGMPETDAPKSVTKADEADLAVLRGVCPKMEGEVEASLAKALAQPASVVAQYIDDLPASLKEAVGDILMLASATEEAEVSLAKAEGVEEKPVSTDKPETKPEEKPEVKPESQPAAKPEEKPVQQPTVDVAALTAALVPAVTQGVLAALADKAKADADAADPEVEVDLEALAREAEEEAAKEPPK